MGKEFGVLIVDDDHGFAATLKDILEEEGYRAVVAGDGRTAQSVCRDGGFALALVDIRLPDISGVALIDKLAELSPAMEYIIVTGYVYNPDIGYTLDRGHGLHFFIGDIPGTLSFRLTGPEHPAGGS